MRFKKNKYIVVKKAIDLKLAMFISKYFLLKKKVAQTLIESKYISSMNYDYGTWEDPQVPGTYSHYSDIVMETLLQELLPLMEKHTKLKLNETYSFARIYKKGDILKRHKDRFSCEISTTLNLGGDLWPIFLEPNIKINLNQGDMLIYRGNILEHWREKFTGEKCIQVFLHYNDKKTKDSDLNKYDTRPHLGLPDSFCKKELWTTKTN
jgi:hypothetical protein